MVEIGTWAAVFEVCGEFPDFAAAFYSSAENYTTLGYGDVVMSAAWKLSGPLEAADGMLMFGVYNRDALYRDPAVASEQIPRNNHCEQAYTAAASRGHLPSATPVVAMAPG